MGRPSPKYTAEFRQRAVELYRGRGCTYAGLAREPGRGAGGISDWVEGADAAGAAPDRDPFQMAEEPRGPRRENDRLHSVKSELLMCNKNWSEGTAVVILDRIHPTLLADPSPCGTAWGSCNPGRPLS